jgi:chloride channel protein, CIC family
MGKSTNYGLMARFISWRVRHVSDKVFMIVLAALMGVFAGIAAYILKISVFIVKRLVTGGFNFDDLNFIVLFVPLIGILLTILFLRYIVGDQTRHGIPTILYTIARLEGRMKPHKTFSSVIGGALTTGFGGSAGLESPIISTGASIGSNLANKFRLDYKFRTLLIGCGSAGAMASIFTTPIAAVVFSLEVLMLDLTMASIIPLLIASVTGAITTKILLSEQLLVHFKVTEPFVITDILYFIVLGLVAGLVSLYFTRMHQAVQRRIERIISVYKRVIIGGAMLSLLIFLFPPLYGEGYDMIRLIMSGQAESLMDNSYLVHFKDNTWVFIGFIFLLIVLKVVATSLTTSSGGIGGIFGPAAVTGGLLGFSFARLINDFGIKSPLHESNFTLVGMAAVLGAVLHAPLTAIFLVAEMSNGYELIVPLMLATAIAYMTIKAFEPYSLFTYDLAGKGDMLSHHKDKSVLNVLNLNNLIEKDVLSIPISATLGDLTKLVEQSSRNLFAVIDYDETLLGIVHLDAVRKDMFKQAMHNTPITKYMIQLSEDDKTGINEPARVIVDKFNRTGNYNMIVVENGKFVGCLSRANIFNAYRKQLLDMSVDDE